MMLCGVDVDSFKILNVQYCILLKIQGALYSICIAYYICSAHCSICVITRISSCFKLSIFQVQLSNLSKWLAGCLNFIHEFHFQWNAFLIYVTLESLQHISIILLFDSSHTYIHTVQCTVYTYPLTPTYILYTYPLTPTYILYTYPI